MSIVIKTNFKLWNFDPSLLIQDGLSNTWQAIQRRAQANAPYLSGTLRRSIWVEPNIITRNTKSINIWPRKVKYAVVREYKNKLHPWTRFYMKKAFDSWGNIIKTEFEKSYNKILRLIKK